MKKISRLPAVPVITHDPYFSLWDIGKHPAADNLRHWTDAQKPIRGNAVIDGTAVRFLGRGGQQSMRCVETEITPLSTRYVWEALGVRLQLTFTSPLLPDDLDILSTPVSFVQMEVTSLDGKEHQVELSLSATERLCCSGEMSPEMRCDFFTDRGLQIGYMGKKRQSPLNSSGDSLTIDWGYLLFGAETGTIRDTTGVGSVLLTYSFSTVTPGKTTLLIGYDDIASIHYFGRMLPAYYARNGKTVVEAMVEFRDRQEELLGRCAEFDRQLLREAEALGGEDYATVIVASYRQSVAAHKLVADLNGDLLFISKENNSNGCAATADVSYPSVPLYLLYCPELVRAMCRPILKFAKMPVWNYDFAPHDVGRYPVLNGQVYGSYKRLRNSSEGNTNVPFYYYPATAEVYDLSRQMPVEECGNMLLMLAAVGYADGNWKLAEENLELLQKWCRYLVEYGEDPGHQLCTDDFAGHLARNINLSAKAFMGVAAYAMILEKLGDTEEAKTYMEKARAMGESWLKRADAGEYSYLTFDGVGWSQKYNLVWDKLFGWNILPDSFYEKELRSYLPRINRYGLPLDSRAPYTKSDWTMWVAAMAPRREIFDALCKPLADFLRESQCRVPFTDFYDTQEGTCEVFIGRSVQGGCFMPLLMQKWRKS